MSMVIEFELWGLIHNTEKQRDFVSLKMKRNLEV